ncbi:MAG: DUF1232 domain-containing protein [Paludibacteraceae bacterium]|nr:DUF1232 domain-containing protein [Paludibacteraceae bacterium]
MNLNLLWNNLGGFARRVGRSMARTPLLLYYVLKDDKTAAKDKAIIYAALAYLILPVDLISARKNPILGWADEILSIEIVYDRMRKYITPDMYRRAEAQLDKWIPA